MKDNWKITIDEVNQIDDKFFKKLLEIIDRMTIP